MRPIIGNSIVVRHISIIRVRSIEAIATRIDSILRHIPLVVVCSAKEEELLSMFG